MSQWLSISEQITLIQLSNCTLQATDYQHYPSHQNGISDLPITIGGRWRESRRGCHDNINPIWAGEMTP